MLRQAKGKLRRVLNVDRPVIHSDKGFPRVSGGGKTQVANSSVEQMLPHSDKGFPRP